MNQEPEIGRASFLPAVLPHVWGFSISVALISIGFSIDDGWVRNGLEALGWVSAILLAIVLVFDFVAQCNLHTIYSNLQDARIAQMYRPVESSKPPPVPEPKIDFPPERFVTWLWTERIKNGKVPTVDECVKAGNNRPLVQKWFNELEVIGAIIGREERISAGDFPVEWTFERLVSMSRKANTQAALPGQRLS